MNTRSGGMGRNAGAHGGSAAWPGAPETTRSHYWALMKSSDANSNASGATSAAVEGLAGIIHQNNGSTESSREPPALSLFLREPFALVPRPIPLATCGRQPQNAIPLFFRPPNPRHTAPPSRVAAHPKIGVGMKKGQKMS